MLLPVMNCIPMPQNTKYSYKTVWKARRFIKKKPIKQALYKLISMTLSLLQFFIQNEFSFYRPFYLEYNY